jgi:hypothetical protein
LRNAMQVNRSCISCPISNAWPITIHIWHVVLVRGVVFEHCRLRVSCNSWTCQIGPSFW